MWTGWDLNPRLRIISSFLRLLSSTSYLKLQIVKENLTVTQVLLGRAFDNQSLLISHIPYSPSSSSFQVFLSFMSKMCNLIEHTLCDRVCELVLSSKDCCLYYAFLFLSHKHINSRSSKANILLYSKKHSSHKMISCFGTMTNGAAAGFLHFGRQTKNKLFSSELHREPYCSLYIIY